MFTCECAALYGVHCSFFCICGLPVCSLVVLLVPSSNAFAFVHCFCCSLPSQPRLHSSLVCSARVQRGVSLFCPGVYVVFFGDLGSGSSLFGGSMRAPVALVAASLPSSLLFALNLDQRCQDVCVLLGDPPQGGGGSHRTSQAKHQPPPGLEPGLMVLDCTWLKKRHIALCAHSVINV